MAGPGNRSKAGVDPGDGAGDKVGHRSTHYTRDHPHF